VLVCLVSGACLFGPRCLFVWSLMLHSHMRSSQRPRLLWCLFVWSLVLVCLVLGACLFGLVSVAVLGLLACLVGGDSTITAITYCCGAARLFGLLCRECSFVWLMLVFHCCLFISFGA
jgi:uncharacterized membrane protein YuzA (DUF378 family)